ncbi:MAG: integron integrase [Desulfobulbaceae bacterium]|nr:integron integrase [Desulfobulbaceae bacterium]
MLQIPAQLTNQFTTYIDQQGIPSGQHRYYLKWMRYYLDFCYKYQFDRGTDMSLSAFLKKLDQKKQPGQLQTQAEQAVRLYFAFYQSSKKQQDFRNKAGTPHATKTLPNTCSEDRQEYKSLEFVSQQPADAEGKKEVPQKRGADWTKVFAELKNGILVRHYSRSTLKTYTGWVRKFQAFTESKDPTLLNTEDVKEFLTSLAVKKQVAASTQNQAFNALLFFFRHVLGKEFGKVDGVVRAKRKQYIPVVLSREEIDCVIGNLKMPYRLIISLMYGCGLRISECLSLRVNNFNFDMKVLTIHDGKGKKDRTVPIPDSLLNQLATQLQRVMALHEEDSRSDYSGVFLPNQLEVKYKNAARELVWQWFFPAKQLTLVDKNNEQRRYHVHESLLQKSLRTAVKKAKIPKRVTSHTFRHSFASHLLQANYDIRTIQELMGHSDVKTTMIYTHTVKSTTKKEAKSPLDF